MNSNSTYLRHLMAYVLLVGTPCAAFAQDSAVKPIDEIIVSAQKKAENVQDVPMSISAFSMNEIRERQINDISDVAAQTPGFHFAEVIGGAQASIRGVGFSLLSGIGEGAVAMHIDGLFLSRPGATLVLQDDIAGVEVLRGPQGTLYGRNATAGVVNFITPAPEEDFSFSATGLAGNFNRYKLLGHLNGSALNGDMRMRLSGGYDRRDDYIINETYPGRDHGGNEQVSVRLATDWDITNWFAVSLRTFAIDRDEGSPAVNAYKPGSALLVPPGTYSTEPNKIRNDRAPTTTRDMYGGSVKLLVDLSDDIRLTSQTGYVNYKLVTPGSDNDGTSQPLFVAYRTDESESYTQELNLSWETENMRALIGAFYFDESISIPNDVHANVSGVSDIVLNSLGADLPLDLQNTVVNLLGSLGSTQAVNIQNLHEETSQSWAIYGDVTYSLTERWRLFAGIRYLEEEKEQILTSRIYPLATGPSAAVTSCENLKTTLSDEAIAGRAGMQFDLADDAMVYGQYSSGYKSGGFPIAVCGDTFKPEELTSYEIGVKATIFDGRLRINASAYHYDYTNLQVEQVVFPTIEVNNGDARVYGGEAELLAAPWDFLDLGFNIAIIDAQYTDFTNSDNTRGATSGNQDDIANALVRIAAGDPINPLINGAPEDLSGNRLNRTPLAAIGLSATFTQDLGRFGSVSLRGEGNYTSEYYLREFNLETDKQEAHWLVNAYINWYSQEDQFSVRAFVKNATDEPVLGGFLAVAGYKTASYNPPRAFGLEMEFRY